ncbi:MAG: NUDIX domain-containing protein [Rhodobacteraceae bacterium]|nr:NUDIX domain-containing protein [Paracoccaceae bacterium]
MERLFFYGTLRDMALLATVSGLPEAAFRPRPAALAGWDVRRVAQGDYPFLRPAPGAIARGCLVEGIDGPALERLRFYEGAHLYRLEQVVVMAGGEERVARAFLPVETGLEDGGPWTFEAWRAADCGLAAEAAVEVMAWHGRKPSEEIYRGYAQIRMRAQARLSGRAADPPDILGAGLGPEDVAAPPPGRPYAEYFAIEHHEMRHRLFRGGMSDPAARAVFMMGDAVTVLPWDPSTDQVLIVEQFRAGPWARCDRRPWMLEPVAGRRDPGESCEQAALREMHEEAGIAHARLHRIADYYPSPGAVSEYIAAFVAECDLAGAGGIFGRDDEGEDIRALVVPLARALEAAAAGEIRSGPLLLSLLWLERNRTRLREASGRPA